MSSEGGEDGRSTARRAFDVYINTLFGVIDKPVTMFREKFVEPIQSKNKTYYYHRKFRRVPTIDTCDTDDVVCIYEADEQFKRDKEVDSAILKILRHRRVECEMYYGFHDFYEKCGKAIKDYEDAETNWFIKYGDLRPSARAKEAYMKQKHRMIWERRHGPVGSGMKTEPQ